MFSEKAIRFYRNIKPPVGLPKGIQSLYPHRQAAVQEVIGTFFRKYYSDEQERHMLVGINPGRFGAGITGINFTAPRQLLADCGIHHAFGNQSELSAEFIYLVIREFGGPSAFYRYFFLGSVSPIGFTLNGKNLNYYDDPGLEMAIRPFALKCLKKQLAFGINNQKAICIGGDKNLRFLKSLNAEYGLFGELIPVPHPRFIMQYRRAQVKAYIREYLDALDYCRF